MKVYLLMAVMLGFAACGTQTADVPTYYRDVLPIMEEKCAACHTSDGIGPFALDSFAEVYKAREIVASSVESGSMPPWPPDNDCSSYHHDPTMSDEQKATVLEWARGDAEEGEPSDAPAPKEDAGDEFTYDVTLQLSDPYTPVLRPDDYRCHIIPWPGDTDEFVTGYQVHPDQAQLVHHVIAFAVPGDMADDFYAYDANDEGAGYTCFGSPFPAESGAGATQLTGTRWIGSWAPGGSGRAFPEGTGIKVEAGSLIIVQIHYNSTTTNPLADQSSMSFRVAESVESPALILPYANPGWILGYQPMSIPAGESSVKHGMSWDIVANGLLDYMGDNSIDDANGLLIHNAGLHMHQLGKHAKLAVENNDGTEECLLEIPDWDFNWQGSYFLKEPVLIEAGDKLSLECEWDNSAENQSVIDGELQEPKDVEWGEGTGDEMCLGIIYVTEP